MLEVTSTTTPLPPTSYRVIGWFCLQSAE